MIDVFGQVQVMKEYDFDKSGYYLLGMRSESDPNGLADTLGEFYTKDPSTLNDFKAAWTFTEPSPMYACGYHYEIHICKGGKSMESFVVNLNCNVIATEEGYFFFDTDKLRTFIGKLDRPRRRRDRFTSLVDARHYIDSILTDTALLHMPIPDWTRYEGEFQFRYPSTDYIENEEKCLQEATRELKAKYPDEDFELSVRGGSTEDLFVRAMCNKTLSDQFDLYPLRGEWDAYAPSLVTYWTERK